MFKRQSIQDKENENSCVITYDYHESNEIMRDKIDISIYEHSDIASYVATKDEIKKLIKILKEVVGEK